MNKLIKTAIIIIFSAIFIVPDVAQSEAEWGWDEILEQKALPEIAKIIKKENKHGWPRVSSLQAMELVPKDRHKSIKRSYDLAVKLFEKIVSFEENIGKIDGTNIQSVINTYSNLSSGLRSKGGYVNILLADSVSRLALRHISIFLVQNTKEYQQAKLMLTQMNLPLFSKTEFIGILIEEGVMSENDNIARQILEAQTLRSILESMGTDVMSILFVEGGVDMSTSFLLRHSDSALLLVRISETDGVAEVYLPGLVEFLKLGGTYADLDLRDIRKFKKIMGKKIREQFKSTFLGIPRVTAGRLKDVFEIFGNTNVDSPFNRIAIE